MIEILNAIQHARNQSQDVVMATIIENRGSSPRSSGAKMLIFSDHFIVGTIGGGKLEAETILAADEIFRTRNSRMFHFELTGEDAADSDMICGGTGDVLLVLIACDDASLSNVFDRALRVAEANEKGWLLTRFSLSHDMPASFCFIDQSGEKFGDVEINEETVTSLQGTPGRIAVHSEMLEQAELLVERIDEQPIVILFGGGHVARETAALAHYVGFRVMVIDDRAEFANPERFPMAKTMVVSTYEKLPTLPLDAQTFIVIVTRGHLGDYDVLRQMIVTDAYYIGMIGSSRKRGMIYDRLRSEGISQAQIDRIHSPIGLPIGGDSPEEIAVSIVAQLIAERTKLKSLPEHRQQ